MKIGYARVSTKDQNLDMQIQVLNDAGCERIFSEKVSGVSKKRPELEKLLEFARSGDEIYVYKLDRLGRSLKDLVLLVDKMKASDIGFYSLSDGLTLNNSPTGQLMFNIFAAFAQFERDLISERTRLGLAAARAKGRKGGRPKGLTKEAEAIAEACEIYYLAGKLPIKEACKRLGVSTSTFYKYLHHRKVKIGGNLLQLKKNMERKKPDFTY